ncbi:MAG: NERD domain-containing protein [Deltaproteobacteria bacterium]|nr:NERD domain-containing protein [Deltaproteobacteria bacterium]
MVQTTDVKIFLGSDIDDPSERRFLDQLRSDLATAGVRAIIFANFLAGPHRRQVDFFVITEHIACVTELKTLHLPVEGNYNGPWLRRKPNGTAEPLGKENPYHQTLHCKYSISDAMRNMAKGRSTVPVLPSGKQYYHFLEGILCLHPDIPPGSKIPQGDYKVTITGYTDLLERLKAKGSHPGWTWDDWLALARALDLYSLDSSDEDSSLNDAVHAATEYEERFRDYYGSDLPPLVPTRIDLGGTILGSDEISTLLLQQKNLLLIGRSGCGKSHALKHASIKAFSLGVLPIFVRAFHFNGNFNDVLNRSIAPFYSGSAINLFRYANAVGKKPCLIIDGINECSAKLRGELLETLQAFVIRYAVPVIFTAQTALQLPRELIGQTAEFTPINEDEREQLVTAYAASEIPSQLISTTTVFKTAYEISLAAQCAAELGPQASQYTLFNAFTRKRLHQMDAATGFRVLVEIARLMKERLTSTISTAEFLRRAEAFAERIHSDPAFVGPLLDCGLVELRHGQCSFRHEMLQEFFEAEGLLENGAAAADIASAVAQPRNRRLAALVLGGLPTRADVRTVLRALGSAELMRDCLLGHYGEETAAGAAEEAFQLFKKVQQRITEGSYPIDFYRSHLSPPPPSDAEEQWEQVVATAIGYSAARGYFLEELANLVSRLDRQFLKAARELNGKDRLLLLDQGFRSAFASNRGSPIGEILGTLRATRRTSWGAAIQNRVRQLCFPSEGLGPGRLLLACYLLHGVGEAVYPMLFELLQNCWKTEIYLLRIASLELIEWVSRHVPDAFRTELASLIDSLDYAGNLMLSTAIVEALAGLDALEPISSLEQAENALRTVLSQPDDPGAQERAYHLLMQMFEEIDQGVHFEAIENLPTADHALLFIMAALGAPEGGWSTGYILQELCRLSELYGEGDVRAVQAFSKYADLPNAKTNVIQDSVAAFAWAVIGLSKHGEDFPQLKRPMKAEEVAWRALGEILFWMHKPNLSDQECRSQCAPLWRRLINGFATATVEPLMLLEQFFSEQALTETKGLQVVREVFEEEIQELLERALGNLDGLSSLFEVGKWGSLSEKRQTYVIRTLGEIGNRETIAKLQVFADHPKLGVAAVEAIRKLSREMA